MRKENKSKRYTLLYGKTKVRVLGTKKKKNSATQVEGGKMIQVRARCEIALHCARRNEERKGRRSVIELEACGSFPSLRANSRLHYVSFQTLSFFFFLFRETADNGHEKRVKLAL